MSFVLGLVERVNFMQAKMSGLGGGGDRFRRGGTHYFQRSVLLVEVFIFILRRTFKTWFLNNYLFDIFLGYCKSSNQPSSLKKAHILLAKFIKYEFFLRISPLARPFLRLNKTSDQFLWYVEKINALIFKKCPILKFLKLKILASISYTISAALAIALGAVKLLH